MPWTSYLHDTLRIISRGFSGLETDSSCGVWGRRWTTCLLQWWSTIRLTFQNELDCLFGMMEWDFIYLLLFIAFVHGFMHETSDFLLDINLFIYQVLCTVIHRRRSLYSFLLTSLPCMNYDTLVNYRANQKRTTKQMYWLWRQNCSKTQIIFQCSLTISQYFLNHRCANVSEKQIS